MRHFLKVFLVFSLFEPWVFYKRFLIEKNSVKCAKIKCIHVLLHFSVRYRIAGLHIKYVSIKLVFDKLYDSWIILQFHLSVCLQNWIILQFYLSVCFQSWISFRFVCQLRKPLWSDLPLRPQFHFQSSWPRGTFGATVEPNRPRHGPGSMSRQYPHTIPYKWP